MNDLDSDIREALKSNGKNGFDQSQADSLHEMIVGSFRGRTRWMVVLSWLAIAAFAAAMIYAGRVFFDARTVQDQIMYATMFLGAGVAVMVIKLWYWILMTRNATGREIKRLELRICELLTRLEQAQGPSAKTDG